MQSQIGGEELLDATCEMWEELRDYHAGICTAFASLFSSRDWNWRKTGLLEKSEEGEIRVEIISDNGLQVGYSISTIDAKGVGEVESLFIKESRRGRGLGSSLLQKALVWLDMKDVTAKQITVVDGNDRAAALYGKFGFRPIRHVLMAPLQLK